MKKLNQMIVLMFLTMAIIACGEKKEEIAVPEFQKAIDDKYKSLAWTEGADNGGEPVKTAGGKGYVQYYGSSARAIYFFPAEGSYAGGTFALTKAEFLKYDGLGQEKSELGRLVSETKTSAANTYATFEKGIIAALTTGTFLVTGSIYTRFVAGGGVEKLGLPRGDAYSWKTSQFVQEYKSQRFLGNFYIATGGAKNVTPLLMDSQFGLLWEDQMRYGTSPQFFPDWPEGETQVSSTGKRYQRFRWFTMYQATDPTSTITMHNAIFDKQFKNVGYERSTYGYPSAGWNTWNSAGKFYQMNYVNGKWVRWYPDTDNYTFSG